MKQRLFYRIPPVAFPARWQDFAAGLAAVSNPASSFLKFQKALTEETGVEKCFLVSSGRSALTLALLAARENKPSRNVLLPAYGCSTLVQSVIAAGLTPVFHDVSPKTLDYQRDGLDAVIGDDLLAVVGAHLYGLVQDFDEIVKLTAAKGVYFIEDAAQCFGGKLRQKMVGTQGDFGFFSLGRGKSLPAGGGGVLLCREEHRAQLEDTLEKYAAGPGRGFVDLISFAGYAAVVNPTGWWFISQSWLNPANAGNDFQHLPKIQHRALSAGKAGLGSSMVTRTKDVYRVWQKNAGKLTEALSRYPFAVLPHIPEGAEPIYLRFPVVLDQAERADRLFRKLLQGGIGASRSYQFTLPGLLQEDMAGLEKKFPGAKHVSQCLITLPTNHYLDDRAVEIIDQAFQAVS